MALPYYLDENNNKVYYTSDNKINLHTTYYDNVDNTTTDLVFESFEDELRYYGFDDRQISNIVDKITTVNDLKSSPAVVERDIRDNIIKVKENGTLLSNSALSVKNTTEFQKTLIEIEKSKLQVMNVQNEIQNKQLQQMDYNLIMQTQLYSEFLEINNNIKAQTEAIKKLKLTADIGNVFQDINIDTSVLSEANQKIADGMESQKAVNDKLLEKLNQETSRDILYNGQTYTKTEIEKLGAVENLKGAKDENEFNLNEALDLVEDFFTDGFDIETNPIEVLINSLKDSLRTEFNEINIKYNLGMENLK